MVKWSCRLAGMCSPVCAFNFSVPHARSNLRAKATIGKENTVSLCVVAATDAVYNYENRDVNVVSPKRASHACYLLMRLIHVWVRKSEFRLRNNNMFPL